jgi:hypothetical protein
VALNVVIPRPNRFPDGIPAERRRFLSDRRCASGLTSRHAAAHIAADSLPEVCAP